METFHIFSVVSNGMNRNCTVVLIGKYSAEIFLTNKVETKEIVFLIY